jgi:hypothetical protein
MRRNITFEDSAGAGLFGAQKKKRREDRRYRGAFAARDSAGVSPVRF